VFGKTGPGSTQELDAIHENPLSKGLGRPVSRILLQDGYEAAGCWIVSDNALETRVSGGILVEACRSESDDVGVGWGKDWGKRSKSTYRSRMSGQRTSTLQSGGEGSASGVERLGADAECAR
jgi:hypothetical protein